MHASSMQGTDQRAPAPSHDLHLTGTAHSRRPLSKKLLFLDLFLEPASRAGLDQPAVEVACKATESGNMGLEQVREAKDSIRPGDKLAVRGSFCSTTRVLSACSICVLERWADMHPGLHFQPQPLPAACHAVRPSSAAPGEE